MFFTYQCPCASVSVLVEPSDLYKRSKLIQIPNFWQQLAPWLLSFDELTLEECKCVQVQIGTLIFVVEVSEVCNATYVLYQMKFSSAPMSASSRGLVDHKLCNTTTTETESSPLKHACMVYQQRRQSRLK